MVDAGFQSENIVVHVVEGLVNVLQLTEDDNVDNIIQKANETRKYTQILPQLMQQIQKMHTLMA